MNFSTTGPRAHHGTACHGFEAARVFGVRLGKGIVEDRTQLESFGAISFFFDPPAGIGKYANVDAMLVHDVEVLLVIKGMKSHSPNIILRFGNEVEIFSRKGVKVSVDNHTVLLSPENLKQS
jgi:hypothetical protein